VDQVTSSLPVRDGSIGSHDAIGWPLVTNLSDRLGFPMPSRLVEVAGKLCVSLSSKFGGIMLTTLVFSRHNSSMV
jgi:hypothetical protein